MEVPLVQSSYMLTFFVVKQTNLTIHFSCIVVWMIMVLYFKIVRSVGLVCTGLNNGRPGAMARHAPSFEFFCQFVQQGSSLLVMRFWSVQPKDVSPNQFCIQPSDCLALASCLLHPFGEASHGPSLYLPWLHGTCVQAWDSEFEDEDDYNDPLALHGVRDLYAHMDDEEYNSDVSRDF